MKPLETEPAITPAAVTQGLSEVGVEASPHQVTLLVRHAELVLEANTRVNLTRITAPEDVVELHIVDSLAFMRHIYPLAGRIVDIGSGAGYPGIPLSVLGHDVSLCESVGKKAAFLEESCGVLGLAVEVHRQRAEELAASAPGGFDVVVARAVSSLSSLNELAAPLLRTGGRLIALKGVPDASEIERGDLAAAMCGMRLAARAEYQLPRGERRAVLVYTKVGKPRLSLPRRPGQAQRQPLGGPTVA